LPSPTESKLMNQLQQNLAELISPRGEPLNQI